MPDRTPHGAPDVSFIMPCYNEEAVIGYTIPRLLDAFAHAGHALELVACDNGSRDRTGEIIRGFVASGRNVVHHRVEVNQGYGYGVLSSIPRCRGPFVGIIPADGQVDAEDVVRLFESIRNCDRPVVAKVHRRFRLDGPQRAAVSFAYNAIMATMWPGLGTFDVNGSPKILSREALDRMALTSKDWLLDAELMIKAHHMGLGVLEMNVFSRMRESGSSHVQASTAWEFLKRLAAFKYGKTLRGWDPS